MDPSANPFTDFAAPLRHRMARAQARGRADDALILLVLVRLDALLRALEDLFRAWRAGELPALPQPESRSAAPRAATPRQAKPHASAGRRSARTPSVRPIASGPMPAEPPRDAAPLPFAFPPRRAEFGPSCPRPRPRPAHPPPHAAFRALPPPRSVTR